MSTFIPSVVVNFRIKFDENLTITTDGKPVSTEDGLENPSKTGAVKVSQPLILRTGDAQLSSVLQRVPKSAQIEFPGYRQAGKWKATFDFRELPIDPRTVAAASVELHTGVVAPGDFARGMRGVEVNGARLSILRTLTDSGSPNTNTMRMLGVVDDWEVLHGDSGSTVELTGRDMRGVLLDTPINVLPGADRTLLDSLDLSKPIDQVVADILAFNPFFEAFTVYSNRNDWPGGVIPAPAGLQDVPRHRRGAKGKRRGGRPSPPSNVLGSSMSFWDLIVRFCYLVGGVPYFNGVGHLIIRSGSTVYDKLRGPVDPITNPTPFADGRERLIDSVSNTLISPALRFRRLVYGRDVLSMAYHRKFGGWAKPKVIRTFCHDPDSGEVGGTMVYGLWPPRVDPPKSTKYAPGKAPPMEEIVNVRVPGITNPERLVEIAKSIFNQVGRAEMGGTIETSNLASFGGDMTDPDLLTLAPGDGVELLVDTRAVRSGAPLVSTLTDHHRTSFEEQVDVLTQTLGNNTLARVLVATSRSQINELQNYFLVTNVKYTWTDNAGMKIGLDFVNYVVARWSDVTEFAADDNIVFTEDHNITAGLAGKSKKRRDRGQVRPTSIMVEGDHVIKASHTVVEGDHVVTATPPPRSPLRSR